MFSRLKKALRNEPPPPSPDHPHSVQERGPITALLVQIYKARVLLNMSFPPEETGYTSALLGIYDEHGFIVLDEITPTVGHKRLLAKREVHVAGRLEGVDFHFTARLMDVRQKGDAAFYKMRLPSRIIYRQRRQDFRITTRGRNINFHALRGSGNNQMLKGYVHDVSRNGLRVVLNDNVQLEPGEILPSCVITLPHGEVLCSLELRFIAHDQPQGVTRMGCRFKQIDHQARQRIQLLINELERDQARRLHGN